MSTEINNKYLSSYQHQLDSEDPCSSFTFRLYTGSQSMSYQEDAWKDIATRFSNIIIRQLNNLPNLQKFRFNIIKQEYTLFFSNGRKEAIREERLQELINNAFHFTPNHVGRVDSPIFSGKIPQEKISASINNLGEEENRPVSESTMITYTDWLNRRCSGFIPVYKNANELYQLEDLNNDETRKFLIREINQRLRCNSLAMIALPFKTSEDRYALILIGYYKDTSNNNKIEYTIEYLNPSNSSSSDGSSSENPSSIPTFPEQLQKQLISGNSNQRNRYNITAGSNNEESSVYVLDYLHRSLIKDDPNSKDSTLKGPNEIQEIFKADNFNIAERRKFLLEQLQSADHS